MLGAFEALVSQFGYGGVFVVSALGSAVPFLPVPYLLVVVLLSGSQNPLLLGLAAGAGGAVGKVTSYLLGRFGYFASGAETRGNVDALHSVVEKYGAVGVFIFAVSPLPDDAYVIPMGLARLPFWRFFAANLAGKLVLSVGVAYLGRAYFGTFEFVAGNSLPATVAAVGVTVVLTVALMKADWPLAVETGRTRGVTGVLAALPEILRVKRKARAPDPERARDS